jgi:hypothetical protein
MTDSVSRSPRRSRDGATRDACFPLARSSGILVEELDGETLIYDLATHEAHCLNRAATLVWRRSDGKTSAEALADLLPQADLPRDMDLVWLALDRLDRAGLLAEYGESAPKKMISRRDVVRALGATAGLTLALPAVSSLVAPLAAQAASCVTAAKCKKGNAKKGCEGLPICGVPNACCGDTGGKCGNVAC